MLRTTFLAAMASVALLLTVNTSDAAWRRGYYGGGYYGGGYYGGGYSGYRPYYNYYRPYAYPVYPAYYGPTYYPGVSYYTPGVGIYIR